MVARETIVVGVLGAIIGGGIVTLLGPVLQPAASYINRNFWELTPFFESPKPTAYTIQSSPYGPGDTVGEFNGQTWQPSYEIVDLYLSNNGQRILTNIRCFMSFGGICIDSEVMESSFSRPEISPISEGEYRLTSGSNTIYETAEHGAMNIFVNRLPPRRSVRLKFLVDSDTRRADNIIRPENEESFVNYEWKYHGVSYRDRTTIENKD